MTYLKRARKILDAVQRKRGRIGHDPSRAVAREESDGVLLEPRSRRFNRKAVAPGAKLPTERMPKPPPATQRQAGPTPLEIALSLEQGLVTGLLKVESPRGSGWVSVVSGAPSKALWNEFRGEGAVAAILQQQGARSAFTPGGAEPRGGEEVKVSFSTVQKRIERHRAKTQVMKRPPKPPTEVMRRPKPGGPAKPPQMRPPQWGDGAR